jgi:hypothetical protein
MDKKMEIIREAVEAYLMKNAESTKVPIENLFVDATREHIISIGSAIMANRLGINTYPGSFVTAVLNNDLAGAINHADSTNVQMLPFYVTMICNLGINIPE